MIFTNNCKTCGNAVFDPLWAEHKCGHYNTYIYDLDACKDCPHWKKGEPKETEEPYYDRREIDC